MTATPLTANKENSINSDSKSDNKEETIALLDRQTTPRLLGELRAALSMPLRFLSQSSFAELLRKLPHAIILEILDGLSECQVFMSIESQAGPVVNFRGLYGRFVNTSDRRFVLVRRNLGIRMSYLVQVSRELDATTFRRNMAALLRSSRYLVWTIDSISSTTQDINNCISVLDQICSKQQFRSSIRSIKLLLRANEDSLGECMHCFPSSLMSFVTHLFPQSIVEQDTEILQNLKNLRHIAVNESADCDWAAIPWRSVRSISMNGICESALVSHLKRDAVSLKAIDIAASESFLFDSAGFRDMLSAMPSKITTLTAFGSVPNIENLHNLTRITFDIGKAETFTAMKDATRTLNERGQLTALHLYNPIFRELSREDFEALGIGHPHCALRELMLYGASFSDEKPQTLDILVPVLKCKHLERVKMLGGSGSRQQAQNLARLALDRGLLLNFDV